MSSSEIHKSRKADQPADQTGDFLSDHNTADAAASVDTSKHPPQSDPLLALLRPPQADGELGRLAHFAITRLLGRGGMGAVFAADDLLLHRKVALKVMRPELTMRPEARERFLREARTAGGLEHDHIISVYEVAEDNGVWFIVMPLLKGEALDARLAREGLLSIPAVLKLGRETAEGLAAAHERGLVHRDIKPANLWLEGTGGAGGPGFRRVKILDFGLARAVQDDQHLTAEGGLLGTPAYMAPEQAAGEEVDHRADLFNLGAVLYRCCAGEPPFSGKTTAAVTTALMTKNAVPVGDKNPNLPAALAKLIMRLLDKTPAGRPQTAAQVAGSLRRIEREQTPDKSKSDSVLGTGTAATGLFMGSLAFVFSFIPFFGWFIAALLALFGIVFSGFALVRALKIKRGQGKAIAGILTSVLAVLWWPLFAVQSVPKSKGALLYHYPPPDSKVADPTPHIPTQELSPASDPPNLSDPPRLNIGPRPAPPASVDPPAHESKPDEKELLNQDFTGLEMGGRPKEWVCPDFGVAMEENRPCLEVTKDSSKVFHATLPPMEIKGDFEMDCEFRLSGANIPTLLGLGFTQRPTVGQEFHLELTGTGAPLRVDMDYLGNVQINAGQKKPAEGYKPSSSNTLRLTRKGDIYNVSINDNKAIVSQTVLHAGVIQVVKIGLTGSKPFNGSFPACLYSVKITSIESTEHKSGGHDKTVPPSRIYQDLTKAAVGSLPEGWTASKVANLAVRKLGDSPALELVNPVLGSDKTTLPTVDLKGDFYADVTAVLTDRDTAVELFFKGPKTKPLSVKLDYRGGVTVSGQTKADGSKSWIEGKPNVLRIERSGADKSYVVKLNDTAVGSVPLTTALGPFTQVDLAVIAVKDAKQLSPQITSVEVVPLE